MSFADEALRAAHRPDRVRMLFVGESSPASGRFFYRCDSGLYRAIREAFHRVDPAVNDGNFLDLFRAAGCYLIDVCQQPVDRMKPRERRAACLAGEAELAHQIQVLQPETLVILVRSIRDIAERAALRSSWSGTLLSTPYPGRWLRHRREFLEALGPYLVHLAAHSAM
jgi:hypothetical protein